MKTGIQKCRILWLVMMAVVLFLPTSAAALTDIIVDTEPETVPQEELLTGSASKKIGIAIPPGRNGIKPSLNLYYNNYHKNGWVGVGWNLGVGAIQRSTKRGVNYSADDYVFSKNGSTVDLVARSDWGAGHFGVKIEGAFSKYYFNSSTGGWEAYKKNGITYYYGTITDSRQENGNGVFKWCLDRVEDSNGNYMTISYVKDQGEIYLDRIDYTGNGGLAPYNSVVFHTEGRADDYPVYSTNSSVSTGFRLKTIAIYAGAELVRAYTLTYGTSGSTYRSLLSSIQEYGSDTEIDSFGTIISGTSYPPTSFSYSDWPDAAFSHVNNQTAPVFAPGFNRLVSLDINGDARKDFIIHFDSGNVENYISNGTGFDFAGNRTTTGYGSTYPNMSETHAMDINGDGKSDFVIRHDGGNMSRYISNGSGFDDGGSQGVAGWEDRDSYRNKMHVMDINGDGKSDFVIHHDGGSLQRYLSNGNSFNLDGAQGISGYNEDTNRFIPMDINGDGRMDFVIHHDSGNLQRYISNGGSFDADGSQTVAVFDPDHNELVPMDINGDGRTDFIIRYDSGNMDIYLSNGSSFVNMGSQIVSLFSRDPGEPLLHNQLVPMDINGDGRMDIVIHHDGGTLERYISKVDHFEPAGSQTIAGFSASENQLVLMDVDGNGGSDFIIRHDGGTLQIYLSFTGRTDHLITVNSRFGAVTQFEYTPSSQIQNDLLPFVMYPVSKITVDDGFGNLSISNFTYANGLYDFAEREFRGFGYAKRTNPDGTTVESWRHQDQWQKGKKYQVDFKDPAGTLLKRSTFTWENAFLDPEETSAFVKLTQKRTEFYDDVTVFKQTDYTHDDSNGNLLSTIASGTDGETITTTNTYQNFGEWLWRLTQKTVEGDASGKVRETYYEYEQGSGNMLAKEFWLDGGINPRVAMTYDEYGNQTMVTDARGNTTVTEYDTATYTFPIRITYPQTGSVAHVVENEEWDYRYGKVRITKDENGNRTFFDYDPFGRLIQKDLPDGGQVIKEFYDDVFPRYVVSRTREDDLGTTIDKYKYYDGRNRKIQTISFGEDDKSIVGKIFYDEMGRVRRNEGPFFATGVGYPLVPPTEYPWVDKTYDYRGRVVQLEKPDGEYGTVSTSFEYSGFSKTITDPDEGKKTEKKDYLGRIIHVTEYNDAEQYNTVYEYNAAGNLMKVTNHFGDVTSMVYDTLGRKISMDDPDMGLWGYTYDPNGNLLTQTDAKGQTTTFEYDELNRVKSKVYSTADPSVVYNYDNTTIPNGIGRLYNQTNTSVNTTIDEYDEMGRVLSATKQISGDTARTTDYEYDFSGKTRKTIYPDNFEVTYDFYPGTNLLHMVYGSDQTTFINYSDYEPTGKIVQALYGNGTETSYSYDPMSTQLTAIFTAGTSGLPEDDIQDKTYRYSKAGDILEINDNLKGITYNYTYDKMHRLISETNTGNEDSFPSMMIENTHSASHVHAVETVNFNGIDYTYEYDENGNMTVGYDFTDPDAIAERRITFNADNMPTQIEYTKGATTTITDFLYDGNGKRAKKSTPGGSSTYYYGDHFEVKNDVPTKYIFAGNMRVAQIKGSNLHYLHKDHLKSSTAMTDADGTKLATSQYLPYGGVREQSGVSISDYKFTDQELDTESGLYNYDARLYDPITGTFISPDSIVPIPFDPQSLNRCSYVRNNPLRYIDPSGHFSIGMGIGAVQGAISGGLAGIKGGRSLGSAAFGGAVGALAGGLVGMAVGSVNPGLSSTAAASVVGAIAGALGGLFGGMTGRATTAAIDTEENSAKAAAALDAAIDPASMGIDAALGAMSGAFGGLANAACGYGRTGEIGASIASSSVGTAGGLAAGVGRDALSPDDTSNAGTPDSEIGDRDSGVGDPDSGAGDPSPDTDAGDTTPGAEDSNIDNRGNDTGDRNDNDTDGDGIGSDGSGSGGGYDGRADLGL